MRMRSADEGYDFFHRHVYTRIGIGRWMVVKGGFIESLQTLNWARARSTRRLHHPVTSKWRWMCGCIVDEREATPRGGCGTR